MNQSETSLEAGELQLVDGPLVAEGRSGDATAWTAFFAQPHLPVEDTREEEMQEMLFTTLNSRRTQMSKHSTQRGTEGSEDGGQSSSVSKCLLRCSDQMFH